MRTATKTDSIQIKYAGGSFTVRYSEAFKGWTIRLRKDNGDYINYSANGAVSDSLREAFASVAQML